MHSVRRKYTLRGRVAAMVLRGITAALFEAGEGLVTASSADPARQARLRVWHVADNAVSGLFSWLALKALAFHEVDVSTPLGRLEVPPSTARTRPSDEGVEMRCEPRFICEAVARQVGIPVTPAMTMPAIHLASKSTLQNFRAAVCVMRRAPNDGQPPHRLRRAAAPGDTAWSVPGDGARSSLERHPAPATAAGP